MRRSILALTIIIFNFSICYSQAVHSVYADMPAAAVKFLGSLSPEQKAKTQFIFDTAERVNWNYVPLDDRKGITLNELNATQKKEALNLLHTALSDTGYDKAVSIMQLENILKEVEKRAADDHHRDPGKYYFSIFGNPATDGIWGWRLEGHHVAFNFSFADKKLVSATPGFLGTNPAIVLYGPEKGKQILKDETELGFSLLHSLDTMQLKQVIFSNDAPGEIFTANSRHAMITDPKGILYSELTSTQQKIFMQLLSMYIHRYTRLFAANMMHEIEAAGLNNLHFAWAGVQQPGVGHPHYYRIQGPTLIIEYDNTQNNANHVHTVIRDLNHDFGGDELMEHYRKNKH